MRIHTCGEESAPVVIMLLGSFCNADTAMWDIPESIWRSIAAGFPPWHGVNCGMKAEAYDQGS